MIIVVIPLQYKGVKWISVKGRLSTLRLVLLGMKIWSFKIREKKLLILQIAKNFGWPEDTQKSFE